MLKAVLFDMDGVIIDSEPLHAKAAIRALKKFGVSLTPEFCYSFIGSTAKHMLEIVRENWQLSGFLNKIVSGMQVAHPKPAPDIFLAAAEALCVLPRECLVIEDSANGLRAAKAAGMTAVAFRNPNSGNQDLSAADYVIEGFDEITPFFLYQVYQHTCNEPAVIAESERLMLRELSAENLPVLHQILSEPSVARFSGEPARSLEELSALHEAYIRGAYHFRGYGLWGIFLKSTGELIGRCGFENTLLCETASIELGYLISEKHRGHGYALEAIRAALSAGRFLGISTVFAVIDPQNAVSVHIAERIGMKPAGTVIRNNSSCLIFRLALPPAE